MYTVIAIGIVALLIGIPVSKRRRSKRQQEDALRQASANTKAFFWTTMNTSDDERDRLVISFCDNKEQIARDFAEDMEFIFGKCWETALTMYPCNPGRDTCRYRDGLFHSPWQSLFHIYCAKEGGHIIWDKYTVSPYGISGETIVTAKQAYRTCAVIEKYIKEHTGGKYLLFSDSWNPSLFRWGAAGDTTSGVRPW